MTSEIILNIYKCDVDIIIVGGGNAGATLANALAPHFSIAVIDQMDPTAFCDAQLDGRTLAITHGSAELYRQIGLWDQMLPHAQPILDIITQDHASSVKMHYSSKDIGNIPMGYIFEIHKFRQILYQNALQPSVQWIAPAKVVNIETNLTSAQVTLDNGQTIRARLCIAADGKKSSLRQSTAIKTIERPYKQTAIVCCIEHELPHNGLAIENFLPNGPFATLPMMGNKSSVVWSEQAQYVDQFLSLSPEDLSQQLQLRVGDIFGKVTLCSKTWTYPLSMHIMRQFIDQRLVFIADAAHSMHPVAGQGFNVGLRDIMMLTEILTYSKDRGIDIGSQTVLAQYQKKRRADTYAMIGFTDFLIMCFSKKNILIRNLRALGMGIVQNTPILKKFLIKKAMGVKNLFTM